MMTRIAHIVNPVCVNDSSDLFTAQPITFETMRIAQRFARGLVDVSFFSTQFPEDDSVIPIDFVRTPDLERSVLDTGDFQRPRKLPLLKDILDRAYQASDAEYIIYTNVDISPLPHFYLAIDQFIESGIDAFVINRRTISSQFQEIKHIPLMYAQIGQPHRGWDCFIFRREVYPHFKLGSVCVGATRVGLALLSNLVAHAERFREFKDEHLTFHIGDERNWLNRAYADYDRHNTQQLLNILNALEDELGAFHRDSIPGSFLYKMRTFGPAYEFWARHFYLPMGLSRWLNRFLGRLA